LACNKGDKNSDKPPVEIPSTKEQIPNKSKITISKFQIGTLVTGICLKFGACDLSFSVWQSWDLWQGILI